MVRASVSMGDLFFFVTVLPRNILTHLAGEEHGVPLVRVHAQQQLVSGVPGVPSCSEIMGNLRKNHGKNGEAEEIQLVQVTTWNITLWWPCLFWNMLLRSGSNYWPSAVSWHFIPGPIPWIQERCWMISRSQVGYVVGCHSIMNELLAKPHC